MRSGCLGWGVSGAPAPVTWTPLTSRPATLTGAARAGCPRTGQSSADGLLMSQPPCGIARPAQSLLVGAVRGSGLVVAAATGPSGEAGPQPQSLIGRPALPRPSKRRHVPSMLPVPGDNTQHQEPQLRQDGDVQEQERLRRRPQSSAALFRDGSNSDGLAGAMRPSRDAGSTASTSRADSDESSSNGGGEGSTSGRQKAAVRRRGSTEGLLGSDVAAANAGKLRPAGRPRQPPPEPTRRAVPPFSDRDDQLAAAYDGLPVTVSGRQPPPPLTSYNQLAGPQARYRVAPLLLRNAAAAHRMGRPTPVQAHVMPAVLEGRDVLAVSVTGSGKTLSYLLPLLALLMARPRLGTKNSASPDGLVLVPTRELAEQVYADAQLLLRGSHLKALVLHGGASVAEQVLAIRGKHKRSGGGVDLLVSTPGRLLQLVERRAVRLGRLSCLVVDEADRLMDLGLWPDLRSLLTHKDLPTARQTVLVAASLPAAELGGPDAMEALLRDRLSVCVGDGSGGSGVVRQVVELVGEEAKPARLLELLAPVAGEGVAGGGGGGPAVVFTRSLQRAEVVARQLAARGVGVALLHRDLTQDQRDEALQCFRFGVTSVLVATSIASRGLNFPDVAHVVNYDVPASASDYVHQVGRTGRGGRPGLATTLFAPNFNRSSAPWLLDCLRRAPGSLVPTWLERQAGEAAAVAAMAAVDGGEGGLQRQAAGGGLGTQRPRAGSWRQVVELRDEVEAGGGAAAATLAALGEGYFLTPPATAATVAGPLAGAAARGAGRRRISASASAGGPSSSAAAGAAGAVVVDRRHDAAQWQARFDTALQTLQPPEAAAKQAQRTKGGAKSQQRQSKPKSAPSDGANSAEQPVAAPDGTVVGMGGGAGQGLLFEDGSVMLRAGPDDGLSAAPGGAHGGQQRQSL